MGVPTSRFKRSIASGDETTALHIIQTSRILRKFLNANEKYGRRHDYNTPLHFAALHGMPNVLRVLLDEFGGNPNETNYKHETSLHLACTLLENDKPEMVERRKACVKLIMQWRGISPEGNEDRIDLTAKNHKGDTALHVAAASGLEDCVDDLIKAGSSLFMGNNQRLTPRDLALKNGHHYVALLLETNMVFKNRVDVRDEDRLNVKLGEDDELFYSFDVKKILDIDGYLCDETVEKQSELLSKAEVLLRDNDAKLWFIPESYRLSLVKKWTKDLDTCFELAGINSSRPGTKEKVSETVNSVSNSPPDEQDVFCPICMLSVKASSQPFMRMKCNHNFCSLCWRQYLTGKINDLMQYCILCPAYNCDVVVPNEIVESLLSPDVVGKYYSSKFLTFIDCCNFIKWCPKPGCGMAIRLSIPEFWRRTHMSFEKKGLLSLMPSRAVECGNGHFFCWDCLGEAHAPSACSRWQKWMKTISELDPEAIAKDMRELEELSNHLWLASNSKPCPGCKSPIQKNEGCNHMRCAKCKFEFCWFCMDSWEKHSSATGGYFRCTNRDEISKADKAQDMLIKEAMSQSREKSEINRFLRYYSEYKNHEHSRKREEEHLKVLHHKMKNFETVLLKGKESPEKVRQQLRFLEDGMLELLKLRRTLCGSCVYGLYLEEIGLDMNTFHYLQRELEAVAEKLSDLLVRPNLRTPRVAVIRSILICRRKRYRFIRFVIKGLVMNGLPSVAKKQKPKLPERISGFKNEDRNRGNSSSSVESVEVIKRTVRKKKRKCPKKAIYSWLDFVVDPVGNISRAVSNSEVSLCGTRDCKTPKINNRQSQKFDDYCWHFMQDDFNYPGHDKKYWKNLKVLRKRSHVTVERTKKRRVRRKTTRSSVTGTPKGVDVNEATALSMQQQKTDVEVTIGDVISEETDEGKSTNHSKTDGDTNGDTNGDIKEGIISYSSVENDLQDVTKIPESKFSRYTKEVLEEKVDGTRFNQSEDESPANSGEPETSPSAKSSEEQLVGDPQTNTPSNFDSEEKEEETSRSPTPIVKQGYIKRNESSQDLFMDKTIRNQSFINRTISRDSSIPDFQFFRRNIPPKTIEEQALNKQLNYSKFEATHSFGTESNMFREVMESKNHKVKANEFKHSSRGFERELVKPMSVKNLIDETSNTSKLLRQEEYFGGPSYCPHSCHINPKSNEFLRYYPDRIPKGSTNNGEMMMFENQETDFRSASEFMNWKDPGVKPFPTKKADFCASKLVRSDYNTDEEYKQPFTSHSGDYLTKKNSLHIDDASCEYESITGLPKSPTLFISGVFITRTPESGHISRKDSQLLQSSSALSGRCYSSPKVQEPFEKYKTTDRELVHVGGYDRSSSLTDRGHGSNSLNASWISTSHPDRNPCFSHRSVTPPRYSFSLRDDTKSSKMPCNFEKIPSHPVWDTKMDMGKSKSPMELEERKMFPLHKSPTEGALSSVLYVNENYSSEDDFHEVLFLLGRSKKDSVKRKKRKERDRKMEFSYKEDRDDFSSAL